MQIYEANAAWFGTITLTDASGTDSQALTAQPLQRTVLTSLIAISSSIALRNLTLHSPVGGRIVQVPIAAGAGYGGVAPVDLLAAIGVGTPTALVLQPNSNLTGELDLALVTGEQIDVTAQLYQLPLGELFHEAPT